MKIIGITGNAGSGKSTAVDYFSSKGISGISADAINSNLRQHNKFLTIVIENVLQEKISDEDGLIDTSKLRNIIFSSPSSQKYLEMILHPIIMENINLQLALLPTNHYCIVEIPLLFEADLLSYVDSILLITTNRRELAKRLNTRGPITQFEVEAILDSQLSDNDKFLLSNDIVLNSDTREVFQDRLDLFHQRNS